MVKKLLLGEGIVTAALGLVHVKNHNATDPNKKALSCDRAFRVILGRLRGHNAYMLTLFWTAGVELHLTL